MAERTTPTESTESTRILPRIISDIHRLARLNHELTNLGNIAASHSNGHANHSDHTDRASDLAARERDIITSPLVER